MRFRNMCIRGLAAIVCCMSGWTTLAGIVSIGAPASVLPGALESNTDIYMFQEQAGLTLGAPLPVDITASGLWNSSSGPGSPGVIPASTKINSYFFHADLETPPDKYLFGVVTLPQMVLGIIVEDSSLDATDAALGAGGTLYPTGTQYRGLNSGLLPDFLFLSGNRVDLAALLRLQPKLDQFRVITVVPEPASGTLLALAGGLAVALLGRRRKV